MDLHYTASNKIYFDSLEQLKDPKHLNVPEQCIVCLPSEANQQNPGFDMIVHDKNQRVLVFIQITTSSPTKHFDKSKQEFWKAQGPALVNSFLEARSVSLAEYGVTDPQSSTPTATTKSERADSEWEFLQHPTHTIYLVNITTSKVKPKSPKPYYVVHLSIENNPFKISF